jgi:hypothetical protein
VDTNIIFTMRNGLDLLNNKKNKKDEKINHVTYYVNVPSQFRNIQKQSLRRCAILFQF